MPSGTIQLCNVPSTIAGCTICERIGSGTFSCVFKAISTSADVSGVRTTVAVKVMNMQASNASKQSSECVVSEIRILKNLKHRQYFTFYIRLKINRSKEISAIIASKKTVSNRNIVHLYDFQWDRNNIYLIMEFCGGGDLASFIKHYGSLPEAVTRRFFRQLASAIQYMRAMNVAHMDLKPQNILLTNRHRPSIKISDFGLSQYLKKGEQASSFRGSPLYMAPEIFCRELYDSRVDLWSCGIILYECLYGVPPFISSTYDGLVEQILSNESINFPMNVHLSYDCLDLLQMLLVRNPDQRVTFERFFMHPFVDIAKLPSSVELDKADNYVKKSQKAESEGDLVEATKLLSNAVQIYMSCLELFDEGEMKVKFREKIKGYLEYAENMKELLRPVVKEFPPLQSLNQIEWSDWPQSSFEIYACFRVHAAELIAHTAHDLECQERWDEALAKYILAIEGAMHVLSNESRNTERAIKLQREVSNWLSAAERIKKYVQVMDDDYEIAKKSDDETAKQFQFHEITVNRQCVIS
uniref:non-specific serine/threonine protein kinase n=1 Tax=Setaria digitata TaxID=48799 RepID=A0A915PUK8_9BILA